MVEANKLVRSFLSVQHYLRADNEFQQLLDFAVVIRSRGLATRYQQSMAKLRKMLDELRFENTRHCHRQFQLEYEIHDYDCLHNQLKGDLNVPNTAQALELYYHLNRLELLNSVLTPAKGRPIGHPQFLAGDF